jgi:hypothetical protein
LGLQPIRGELPRNALAWVLGIALVYSVMFGTGALIFDQPRKLTVFGVIAAVSAFGLMLVYRNESSRDSTLQTR